MSQAENFESYYVYSANTHNNLRVGTSMIEEVLEREAKKHEEEEQRREREKQEEAELVEKVRVIPRPNCCIARCSRFYCSCIINSLMIANPSQPAYSENVRQESMRRVSLLARGGIGRRI